MTSFSQTNYRHFTGYGNTKSEALCSALFLMSSNSNSLVKNINDKFDIDTAYNYNQQLTRIISSFYFSNKLIIKSVSDYYYDKKDNEIINESSDMTGKIEFASNENKYLLNLNIKEDYIKDSIDNYILSLEIMDSVNQKKFLAENKNGKVLVKGKKAIEKEFIKELNLYLSNENFKVEYNNKPKITDSKWQVVLMIDEVSFRKLTESSEKMKLELEFPQNE
ncbi:MAG: hypothetical protein PHO33_04560 [Clostridia bacterium]|nr:hypothetical protein [Clostridia bacterium]